MLKATDVYHCCEQSGNVILRDATAMPKACGFLWNKKMMIQANCQGYVTAQHMQPEPAKYSHGPTLAAQTFMQPEHEYYAHHPGRFFYIKQDATDELFSLPYAPVKKQAEQFEFVLAEQQIKWLIKQADLHFELSLQLTEEHSLERWQLKITNQGQVNKRFTLAPYFSIGYMSWMNQSANYDPQLQALIASSVSPYQKLEDYPKVSQFKDQTFFWSEQQPDSWVAGLSQFEGQGGLHRPDALFDETLQQLDIHYETPAAVMLYELELLPGQQKTLSWLFGPAKDKQEIQGFIQTYSDSKQTGIATEKESAISIETASDKAFEHFCNHWLPRQLQYHGQLHRLTTDPQTRNFLQDIMGMVYLDPQQAKTSFLHALQQQSIDGHMPDGILLHSDAELKYINQIPHTDHCVWLVLFLDVYLRETNDSGLLQQELAYRDSSQCETVFQHIQQAMQSLLDNLDYRGLSLINQGDWCDPMNMVGYKGKGVSAWLTMASSYSFALWAEICRHQQRNQEAEFWLSHNAKLNLGINQYFWDGNWYARGITDGGVTFGIADDKEGRIYLNPQGWSLLCKAADDKQRDTLLAQVKCQLDSPYGVMMLAPAYTQMRDDVGRLTQKYPGVAENGSVYNHAAAFYAFSLYQIGKGDEAFSVLSRMLVGPSDCLQRGQLPVYIPNYYRGAYGQIPEAAGRSSHLFNTGTVAWFYRCVIEGLFGLTGAFQALVVNPQLPSSWQQARIKRMFQGASFDVTYRRQKNCSQLYLICDGERLPQNRIENVQAGQDYQLEVVLPFGSNGAS